MLLLLFGQNSFDLLRGVAPFHRYNILIGEEMYAPKFNSFSMPNPFGEIDPDCGDDDCLFKNMQADHIYEVPLTPSTPQAASVETFLDLEDPNLPSKKNLANCDTSKTLGEGHIQPSQLSPSKEHSQATTPCQSTQGDSKELEAMEVESYELFSRDIESEPQRTIQLPKTKKIRSHGAPNPRKEVDAQGQPKKYKKDERKNMYGYSFKFIVKEFLSNRYSCFFNKLCLKFGVTNKSQVRDFYAQKLRWSISLKDLRSFLNFDDHSPGDYLRGVKQVFQGFYVWYMRKRYTLHILTQDKIEHKLPYLEAKNHLIYLPNIKEIKEKRKSAPNDCAPDR